MKKISCLSLYGLVYLVLIFLGIEKQRFIEESEVNAASSYTVNSSQSTGTIQSVINGASSGDTVLFTAGTYTLTGGLTLKCGVTYTGPIANPATAIVSAPTGSLAFNASGCTSGATTTIEYLGSKGPGGGIELSGTQGNFLITNNQIYGLQSADNNIQAWYAAVHIDGGINDTISNLTISNNTFGDPNSCTTVFALTDDSGGNCAGVFVIIGYAINNTIEYNFFNHVEEGVHYNQLLSSSSPPSGSPQSVVNNLNIEYNYFLNWHRIATEIQTGIIGTAPMNVSHNSYVNPINPSYGTMFISDACCTGGRTYLTSSPPNPANTTEDNLLESDGPHTQQVGGFYAPVIGIEYWTGAGGRANWNNIQENSPTNAGVGGSNGVNWGFAVSPYYIANNYVCGSHGGTYITDEEGSASPTLSNNTTSATCAPQTTYAPTITQSTTAVTITDLGRPGVPGNEPITIFYTINGANPTVNSTLYTGPFTPPTGSVVKAIGMWGVAPMPMTYPSNIGWIPSAPVSLTYTGMGGTGPTKTLTGLTIATTGGTTSFVAGSTNQLIPTCHYSDGTTDGCSVAVTYSSSSTSVATVSSTGLLMAVAVGNTTISAIAGTVASSPNLSIGVTAVAPTLPALTSCGQTNTNNVNTLVISGPTVNQQAFCYYSATGENLECDGTGDKYGSKPNHWYSSAPSIGTVQDISGAFPGQVAGVSAGVFNSLMAVTAGTGTSNSGTSFGCAAWTWTVSAATLTSITITSMGGVTSIQAPNTLQMTAIGNYSNGTTTNLTSSATWSSSVPAAATINSSGLAMGVGTGSTNITAAYGGITSSPFALTVTVIPPPAPGAILSLTHSKFTGKVKIQ